MNRRQMVFVLSISTVILSGSIVAGTCWVSAKREDARERRAIWLQEEAWKKERNQVLVLLWGEKIWANTTVEDYLEVCKPSRITNRGKFQKFLHGNPDSTSTLLILAKVGKLIYASDSSCFHRTDFFDRLSKQDRDEYSLLFLEPKQE